MKRAGSGHLLRVVNPLSTGKGEIDGVEKWLNAVNSRGGTVSDEQYRRVDTLARTLQAAGVWPKLDRMWLVCAEDWYQSTADICAGQVAQPINAPEFVAGLGMLRAVQSQNLNLVYVPDPIDGNYSQDSTSFGVWTVAMPDEGKPMAFDGWGLSNRLAPDDLRLYVGNAQLGDTLTEPDLPLATEPFNAQGVPRDYAQAAWSALAVVSIGGGLDDAQRTALFDAVCTYLAAFNIAPPVTP